MKKNILFSLSALFTIGSIWGQVYSPIVTTGYTLDAVAENTTALSTTGGAIDGSNYVMYSSSYGAIYGGSATGLPNNGLIANGTRTYQLQSYTTTNVLFVPTLTSDSIIFTTPAPYPSLSLLGFATEGSGTMNAKVRFTDGTTQLFSGLSLSDWFSGTNTVTTGFDRANRTTGTPSYVGPAGNPKMYFVDLNLTCANSVKNVQRIVIQNTGNNPRLCIMAVSGALSPGISANSSPVTCSGGTNGSATVTVNNGVPPFTYTWPNQAPQNSNVATLLGSGTVNYTVTDASSCTFTSSVVISQSIVPTAPITITASALQVCSGNTVELITSGANTYTWSNNGNSSSTTVTPVSNTLYNVVATTSDNCTVTGSITINTTPLPVTNFTVVPSNICLNAPALPLSASPVGGTFEGNSIIFNIFYANLAGAGTHTLAYKYTDQNGCTSVNTVTTVVSTPTTVIAFTITPSSVCVGATAMTLNAQPAGGTYTGSGVTPAGVFNPSVAGIGTRTVSYTYTDANNCTVSKIASVNVSTCSAVGIKEIEDSQHIEIYPNPNNGFFTIKTEKGFHLLVVNELGQTIRNIELNADNKNEAVIENLPTGLYFIESLDGVIKKKIVVTK